MRPIDFFAHSFLICDKTKSATQRKVISVVPKNRKLEECSELAGNWRDSEGFLSRRGIWRISNQELWIINETIVKVDLQ